MIEILEKAITEIAKLPETQQASMAQWILDELADEERWDRAFEQSLPELEHLGKKALDDYIKGHTEALDPDTLA